MRELAVFLVLVLTITGATINAFISDVNKNVVIPTIGEVDYTLPKEHLRVESEPITIAEPIIVYVESKECRILLDEAKAAKDEIARQWKIADEMGLDLTYTKITYGK